MDHSTKENILVITPSWVGDCIMIQPFLALLKKHFTSCKITILAPPWTIDLTRHMIDADDFIECPIPWKKWQIKQRWEMAQEIKKHHFTRAYILPKSIQSALIPFWAKIPIRIGFLGKLRYGLLTHIHPLNPGDMPCVVARFSSLAYDDPSSAPEDGPLPKLFSLENNRRRLLQKLSLFTSQPVIALCPDAEFGPSKEWPIEHFIQIASYYGIRGYQIWILGSEKAQAYGDQIVQEADTGINLCGKATLNEIIDLLGLCNIVISNDSDLMYASIALNRPTIALYGSSTPDRTPLFAQNAHTISVNLPCSPCFRRQCPFKHTNCMAQISPALVKEKIDELLPKPKKDNKQERQNLEQDN